MTVSVRRIAAVTLALSAIGAVVGGVMSALAFWTLAVAVGLPPRPEDWRVVRTAAEIGGILGAVLAPVAAWTLMRHVPLWRAIVETALGTALGIAVGWAVGPRVQGGPVWPFGLGLAGFFLAAVRLRLTRRGARRVVSGPELP